MQTGIPIALCTDSHGSPMHCHEVMCSLGCPREHFPFYHLPLLQQALNLPAHSLWFLVNCCSQDTMSSSSCSPSNEAGTAGQGLGVLVLPPHSIPFTALSAVLQEGPHGLCQGLCWGRQESMAFPSHPPRSHLHGAGGVLGTLRTPAFKNM